MKIIINNQPYEVEDQMTILDVCQLHNIEIPTLCYHPDQSIKASCRVCLVKVEGVEKLQTACSTKVTPNMNIKTDTDEVLEARKINLELLLANHSDDCKQSNNEEECELKKLAEKYHIKECYFKSFLEDKHEDTSTVAIVRDSQKCIKCGRCIEACHSIQGLNLLEEMGRSNYLKISGPEGKCLKDMDCVLCGQCSLVCPVGAIREKDDIEKALAVIKNPDKHVIVQVAPSVRVSIGDAFNCTPGTPATKKLVSALKELGFDSVFDTNYAADLTIIEEGYELIERFINKKPLPMITSCCPGWVNYAEHYYPEILENLSTAKSPQQMFGAVAKTYYSKKMNINPENIVVVSIMPCTAKKYEASREEMKTDGIPDVDIVLTTREIIRMIKNNNIDFNNLEDKDFDNPFGIASGAGTIFGNSGGVMEAALRTVCDILYERDLDRIDFEEVRGIDGVKEATIKINGESKKVAVIQGLANAKKILDDIKDNKSPYFFIEIMSCPSGCIGGGGQPHTTTNKVRKERMKALYNIDSKLSIRKSHKNPTIFALYTEFLDYPLSSKAHHLLHTKYTNRKSSS